MSRRAALRKLARTAPAAGALGALLVGASVLALRAAGALQFAELAAYDHFLTLALAERKADPRIVFVNITEADIAVQGRWPLPDEVIARAIEALAAHRPRAIGLDLYRDFPVPPGSERLRAVLEREPRVVGVRKFPEGPFPGIAAHPALAGTEREGFNDILVDAGGTVRRGLLFIDDGAKAAYAFALRLALLYLREEGIVPGPDPVHPTHLRLGRTTIRPLEANEGAYVHADTRGYQFLLDFRGADARPASVTLSELLAGRVDPAAVRDKVALIGVTAESVKDHFYTPYSRALGDDQQFAGAAIHFHVASQLLRLASGEARPIAIPPPWAAALWVLAWSATGSFAGIAIRAPWRFALAVLVGLAALTLVCLALFARAWWLPVVPAAAAWCASAAVAAAYSAYSEARQRGALMRLFSSSVSREIAESIWQRREEFLDGGRPRSERLVVTVLFTDLTGFTTVSERLGPEALMDWLNEYMQAMAGLVSRHGGVIRQYAGDSIVALFGVPFPRRGEAEIARDAVNAVECALAMEATLRALNRTWAAQGRPSAGMRIGIFTGAAVAGTLGSAERSEYVVVGDTVNTASRLESFDKQLFPPDPGGRACRILIGESTCMHLGHRFVTERVGDVLLRGKDQPVGVYRVLAQRSPPCSDASA